MMKTAAHHLNELLEWLQQRHPLPEDTLRHRPQADHRERWFTALLVFAGTLLRQGPGELSRQGYSFARYMVTCQRIAALGGVHLSLLAELRHQSDTLQTQLVEQGFLEPASAAWWQPLPEPSQLEAYWSTVQTVLSEWPLTPGSPHNRFSWEHRRAVLPDSWLEHWFPRLEQAYQNGELTLEREGVGGSDQLSEVRGDSVHYFSGYEPWLIDTFPELACLIQLMARDTGQELATRVGNPKLRSPQRAMLARYPAPNQGYRRHVDNPGGDQDNGRGLTLIVYLNPPSQTVKGGDLKLWPSIHHADTPHLPPDVTIASTGGTIAIFDSRTIPHEVCPIQPGPARWALSFWFNDHTPPMIHAARQVPMPSVTELMIHHDQAKVPKNSLWFHRFDGPNPKGQFLASLKAETLPRVGVIATTYGAGNRLRRWCNHHLAQGAQQLFLVFDKLAEPAERRNAAQLLDQFPQLTILASQSLADQKWAGVPTKQFKMAKHLNLGHLSETPVSRDVQVLDFHQLGEIAQEGNHSSAVCARQTLNASYVLAAIQRGELPRVDWLVHMDDDEFLHCLGDTRGGATLNECLGSAQALGHGMVRFLNHELLLPRQSNQSDFFKINPRLAAAKLGHRGWQAMVDHLAMDQAGSRPYFSGFHNGKAAVFVDAGQHAAGVHSWALREDSPHYDTLTVVGPVVLHVHCADETTFCEKFLRKTLGNTNATQLFQPSPLEEAARALLAQHPHGRNRACRQALQSLYRTRLHFSDSDISWLAEAGLLFSLKNGSLTNL